jgi:hypothetical protein
MTPSPTEAPATLRRLTLLREFKLRMLRSGGENHSPFADRIATSHGDSNRVDLNGLHRDVRDNIARQIEAVRTHQRSQVILLSGDAGTGKSHILRHFAQPTVAEEFGYIYVGGSNDWDVNEFQPCLLDWMITALTSPSPSADHPLLERIRAIGYRALGQLLENRTALKRCSAKRRGGWLRRLLGRRRASYETIAKLTHERNPEVFALLDFTRFSEEVCTRFLAFPGNPVHRYAMRVLLTYLFPDTVQTGIGTRERVLNWFRRKPDDGYWTKRLGVADDLTRRYAVADAIKLLIHLFSPELSARLSVKDDKCEPRVFLFVFDQVEGRDELFETLDDWNHFFAHLSELYNTLPNVLVLFTMTLRLRNELHPKMERQFKDRIRNDERFVLRQPTLEQICALYRARVDGWLRGDADLQRQYRALPEADQCLPFSAERVSALGSGLSVRGALETIDPVFVDELRQLVIEPEYDFEFIVAEQQSIREELAEWDYTVDHLDTVWELIEPLIPDLALEYAGVRLMKIEEECPDGLRVLRLEFENPSVAGSWVCVYLTRFGSHFNAHIPKCETLLYRRQERRYSVWMARPREMPSEACSKPAQMFGRLITSETEARLWAAKHLLEKRADYEAKGTWAAAWRVIRNEIGRCYLGELFAHVRDRVNALNAGVPDEPVPT